MNGTNGIQKENPKYLYELVTSQLDIENEKVLTSGIRAYKKEYKRNVNISQSIKREVHISENYSIIKDISTNKEIVEKIIDYLYALNVCPIHLKDIVEDFLQSY